MVANGEAGVATPPERMGADIDVPAHAVVTERLWWEFSDRLRGFIASQVSDPGAVEDILQEVFVKIHRRSETVRDADRLTSWIYRVTRNAVIDHYRRAPRRRELPTDRWDVESPAGSQDAPAEPAEVARQEMAACVRPLLQQLPPAYREALELVELQGLTQTEAARRVGISVSGMKSRVQRGRSRLHQTLRSWCEVTLDARGQPVRCVPETDGCGPPSAPGACS